MTGNLSLMTPDRVSLLLNVPKGRLDRWRSKGVGPAFVKLEGRVFYDMDSVVAFVNRSTVQPIRAADAAA